MTLFIWYNNRNNQVVYNNLTAIRNNISDNNLGILILEDTIVLDTLEYWKKNITEYININLYDIVQLHVSTGVPELLNNLDVNNVLNKKHIDRIPDTLKTFNINTRLTSTSAYYINMNYAKRITSNINNYSNLMNCRLPQMLYNANAHIIPLFITSNHASNDLILNKWRNS